MKLQLKYCGGCNPAYDRVALVRQILTVLEEKGIRCQTVNGGGGADHGLMVCGCDACCIDREENKKGAPDWIVIGPQMINYLSFPLREVPHQIAKTWGKEEA